MRDMPSLDELLGDTPDQPAPICAIVAIIGSPGDDSECLLELRPWPDATDEERSIIARIELCPLGPGRELLKHSVAAAGPVNLHWPPAPRGLSRPPRRRRAAGRSGGNKQSPFWSTGRE
jgi:hypothetical protein